MRRFRLAKVVAGAAVLLMGVMHAGCLSGLTSINPCGTVLATEFCDPDQFAMTFGNFWRPNFDVDPTCTVAFFGNECPDITGDAG